MTKWITTFVILLSSLALNVLQYIGSPILDSFNQRVETLTGVTSNQLSLQRAIEAQRLAHSEAVTAVRRMATRRITRIAARAPAELASSFVGQVGVPVTTSLIAWDLFDLCMIGKELEALEANVVDVESSANLCGYDVSLNELLRLAKIKGLDGLEALVDPGQLVSLEELFESEVWTDLKGFTESAFENWEDIDQYKDRISNFFQ